MINLHCGVEGGINGFVGEEVRVHVGLLEELEEWNDFRFNRVNQPDCTDILERVLSAQTELLELFLLDLRITSETLIRFQVFLEFLTYEQTSREDEWLHTTSLETA